MPSLAWLTHRSYRANIPKFFVFRFIWDFQLFLPIWVIFLQRDRGFSLTQVTMLNFAFWLTMAIGEIPTGAVADTFGRQRSLFAAVCLAAFSISFFVLAPTYPLLLLANALWAIAMTFDSGAALALLYDSLREVGREKEYTRMRGQLAVVTHLAVVLGSAVGGVLGAIDLALPFLVDSALLVAALGLVCTFKEPPQETDPMTGQRPGYGQTLKVTAQALGQHKALRYALLYSGLMPLATVVVGLTLLQPHAIALGVPIAAMGLVPLAWRGVGMVGSATSAWLVRRWGEVVWLRLVPVLIVAGMVGLGLSHTIWGIALFALVAFASSSAVPVVESIVLRQAPRGVAATILSVDSLIFRVLLASAEPAMGWLADMYGLPTAFLALGVVVGCGLLLVLILWARYQGMPLSALPHSP
jgi:MFS family permease